MGLTGALGYTETASLRVPGVPDVPCFARVVLAPVLACRTVVPGARRTTGPRCLIGDASGGLALPARCAFRDRLRVMPRLDLVGHEPHSSKRRQRRPQVGRYAG